MTYPSELAGLYSGRESFLKRQIAGRLRWIRFGAQPPPIALIIGCARSGTSILGELLASHPLVDYLFEANKIWESIAPAPDGSHRLLADRSAPEVCRRMRRAFLRQLRPGAGLVVEKCPRNALRIPFLRAVFPQARLIHIIRDGRDTACSLVPGMASGQWLHLRPPGWQEIQDRHEGAVRCAVAWQTIVQIARADLKGSDHLEIRYERLVADPQGTADALLEYLRLPQAPAVREFARRIQDHTARSYQARFQSQWYRADHEVRVGRWHENLSQEQQDTMHALIGPTLSQLGYEVPSACRGEGAPPPAERVSAANALAASFNAAAPGAFPAAPCRPC
jgi:LPS sulfotransferase NodH